MLTSLGADYVRTARAKGLSEWAVVGRHALRNSLITVTTVIGLQLGAPDLGRRDHRDDLRDRRLRQADDRGGQPARLHADPGRRARRRGRLRDRQPRSSTSSTRCSTRGSASPAGARERPSTQSRLRARARAGAGCFASASCGGRWRSAGSLVVLVFVLDSALRAVARTAPAADTDFNALLAHPSSKHLLGTDELGRDVLSRLIWGSRASMQAGFFATVLAMVLAVPIGLVAGYYRGWVDTVIARADRRAARVPVHHPRGRARRDPRAVADQRDDRARRQRGPGADPDRARRDARAARGGFRPGRDRERRQRR